MIADFDEILENNFQVVAALLETLKNNVGSFTSQFALLKRRPGCYECDKHKHYEQPQCDSGLESCILTRDFIVVLLL